MRHATCAQREKREGHHPSLIVEVTRSLLIIHALECVQCTLPHLCAERKEIGAPLIRPQVESSRDGKGVRGCTKFFINYTCPRMRTTSSFFLYMPSNAYSIHYLTWAQRGKR